jgi:hypothetical protein
MEDTLHIHPYTKGKYRKDYISDTKNSGLRLHQFPALENKKFAIPILFFHDAD